MNETSVLSLRNASHFCYLQWLVKFLAAPLVLSLSVAALSFMQARVSFFSQYIYETNENGDKVVLGKGTYGVVYAGRDLSNQVRIAIKEIPEKDSTYENTPTVFPTQGNCFQPYWETELHCFSQECLFPKQP